MPTHASAAELVTRRRRAVRQPRLRRRRSRLLDARPAASNALASRVTDTDGTIEIVATDGNTVVDEGRRTYLRDRLGWTGVVVEPSAARPPRSRSRVEAGHRRRPHGRRAPRDGGRGRASRRPPRPADRGRRRHRAAPRAPGPRAARRRPAVGALHHPRSGNGSRGRRVTPGEGQEPDRRSRCRRRPTATAPRARRPASTSSRAHATPTAYSSSTATGCSARRCSSSAAISTGARCPTVARDTATRRHADAYATASRAVTSRCGRATASCTRA